MKSSEQERKIDEFFQAMEKYEKFKYKRYEFLVSCIVVTLQIITVLNVILTFNKYALFYSILAVMIAYVATDFINGLIHMFMDNNTHYTSIVGPYIAAFHFHHAKYVYRVRPYLRVYFDETGTKFWLLGYMLFLVIIQFTCKLSVAINTGLVAFGILSSVAEVSHYWCHNATEKNKLILWLQKRRILLSKSYHSAHHSNDNTQYAFLNGIADPLINVIARSYYKGYKNYADKHVDAYMKQTKQ